MLKPKSVLSCHYEMLLNDHENYIHEQNSKIENTPSIIILFGDNRILEWRRNILTTKPDGKDLWITDKKLIHMI